MTDRGIDDMKLTPQDCVFAISEESYDGVDRMQIAIFPRNNAHPLIDRADESHFTDLPPYLRDRAMDSENMWDVESSNPKAADLFRLTSAVIRQDMEALGYQWDEKAKSW